MPSRPGHDHRRRGQVGVATGVAQPQFQAPVGDPNHRGPVVVPVGDVGRRPGGSGKGTAHHQPLVGVDRRGHQGRQGRTVGQQAAQEVVGHFRQPQSVLVGIVLKKIVALAVPDRHVDMAAGPGAVGHGLGHEGADHPELTGDLSGGHAEEHVAVGRGQCRGEGEVDLELAVGVLMVDLVDVESDRLQRAHQLFQEGPAAGESPCSRSRASPGYRCRRRVGWNRPDFGSAA